MEKESSFRLIHAIDPTKVNVPFKDKFSKLTLSSNKKQVQAEQPNPQQLEKRQSASRSLFDELSGTDAANARSKMSGGPQHINALLRSESSSKEGTDELEETHLSAAVLSTHSEFMEPLQISDDLSVSNDLEQQVEALSQVVSGLTINPSEVVSGLTINPSEPVYDDIEHQHIKTICISSTSSEDSYGAITVSDSSLGDAVDNAFDYDLVTSHMPQSSDTIDALLLGGLSNEGNDRMAAFLRDVSQERRAQMAGNDVQVHIKEELVEAHRMATADTESMTPYEEESDDMAEGVPDRKQRLLALDDTAPMSQSHGSLFDMEPHKSASHETPKAAAKCSDDYYKRLANDDTEANTLTSDAEECNDLIDFVTDAQANTPLANDSTLHSPNKSLPPVAEDSLIIPETSSEEEHIADHNSTPPRTAVQSDESADSSATDSPLHSQISQIQMSMGSINISAKINIKIQIPQHMESEDSDTDNTEKSHETADRAEEIPRLPTSEEQTEISPCCQKQQKQDAVSSSQQLETPASILVANSVEVEDEEVNSEFIDNAEKLLTQLYGSAWQTPEVLRTLRRTDGNKASTCKKQGHVARETTTNIVNAAERVDDTVLDDFSIFRRNIVKTNLDSTRLVTPTTRKARTKLDVHAKTEPRRRAVKSTQNKNNDNHVFKLPQTEKKRRELTARKGNLLEARWRQLVDDDIDSEGDNASDDPDADNTVNKTAGDSDQSWRKESSSEDSDGDKRTSARTKANKTRKSKKPNGSKDDLIYLDLSKNEVTVLEGTPSSPPANNDANFRSHLQDILRTCRHEDKPKLVATPKGVKSKRKLFTAYSNDDDEFAINPLTETTRNDKGLTPNADEDLLKDYENIPPEILPPNFNILNKPLNAVKTGRPIFQLTPPRTKQTPSKTPRTYTNAKKGGAVRLSDQLCATPNYKYGFLKSLDVCVSKVFCHPDALIYRENYRLKKEELARILYEQYNEKLFDNTLHVPLVWNKKLSNTAGRCLNKKKLGTRSSVIELSEKVLTSADRLRCTLIHELCHAATWIFNGEGGHGSTWKEWARKANSVFPEIPKIGVCHQYDIEYKYTYKCTLCAAKSHAHSKSKKVENIRCSYCHGAIEIFLNKKDKDGNVMPTPVREPTGFAKFVKDKYKQFKRPELKHADIMKILSTEFAALKVAGGANL